MKSVADAFRIQTTEAALRLTPGERVMRALTLGDADVELFASARDVPLDEARRVLRRQRQYGRQASASHDPQR